jgi:hypothetical protein
MTRAIRTATINNNDPAEGRLTLRLERSGPDAGGYVWRTPDGDDCCTGTH